MNVNQIKLLVAALAGATAITVIGNVIPSDGSDGTVELSTQSADAAAPPPPEDEPTPTTTATTTTTAPAEVPVDDATATTTTTVSRPAPTITTTTTGKPAATVEATLGPVEYRPDGPMTPLGTPQVTSSIPVTVTVTNGPIERLFVCVQGVIDNDSQSPFNSRVFFTDVAGTATQADTYGYGATDSITADYYMLRLRPEARITMVHIVRHAWDPTSCPPSPPPTVPVLIAPANVVANLVDGKFEVSWDPVPGASGYVLWVGTNGPFLAECCTTMVPQGGGSHLTIQPRRGHETGVGTTIRVPDTQPPP